MQAERGEADAQTDTVYYYKLAPVLSPCLDAFRQALYPVADLSLFAPPPGHSDLFPAYWACRTLDEWTEASERFPVVLQLGGVDPVCYALKVCNWAADEQEGYTTAIQGSPICEAVAV